MKQILRCLFILPILLLAGSSHAHFTGKGHLHTVSEAKQVFWNSDCQATDSCDLKRFALTTSAYEAWFSDDPRYPTFGNGVIMEYETASVAALEKYVIVQFKKGCVFNTSKTRAGKIDRNIGDTAPSFGENVSFCFPHWVIDSQDSDPAYNSDPERGRFYLLRWNKPGSYNNRTQKLYGIQKPRVPIVYMTDYPAGAFVSETGVRNVALQFKTCIYKASDVPAEARRDNIGFAQPITCFQWQNVYVYDFVTGNFRTEGAYVDGWEATYVLGNTTLLVIFVTLFLALALVTFSYLRNFLSQTMIAEE